MEVEVRTKAKTRVSKAWTSKNLISLDINIFFSGLMGYSGLLKQIMLHKIFL